MATVVLEGLILSRTRSLVSEYLVYQEYRVLSFVYYNLKSYNQICCTDLLPRASHVHNLVSSVDLSR